MDISQKDAQESLSQIETVGAQTRKKVAADSASPFLILWGAIWFVAYLGTYLTCLFDWKIIHLQITDHINVGFGIASLVWMVLVVIGIAASWIISVKKTPVRSSHDKRFFLSWLIMFIYANVWLVLLWPWNEYQMSAFVASLPMFSYIIMGLWADRFLLWVGLAATVLIITGFFLFHFQPLFWLWMAVLGGGSLAGTGVYIRIRWR